MCQKKKIGLFFTEGVSLSFFFFFFFFWSVDPAEVAAYVTGTVSVETHEKVRKHEQEGRKGGSGGGKNMKRA